MERAEIAGLIVSAILSAGSLGAALPFLTPETVWTLTSADQVSLREKAARGLTFTGPHGGGELADYLRKQLRVISGEMTGCITRRDVTFVFGKLQLESQVSHQSADTSFAARLTFQEALIQEIEIQVSWVLPV